MHKCTFDFVHHLGGVLVNLKKKKSLKYYVDLEKVKVKN